jgi:hypothetical protein
LEARKYTLCLLEVEVELRVIVESFTMEEMNASPMQGRALRLDRWPTLQIGPIYLECFIARNGMGYVYFGHHSDEYGLAVTNGVDISRIDGSRLNFPAIRLIVEPLSCHDRTTGGEARLGVIRSAKERREGFRAAKRSALDAPYTR